MRGKFYPNFLFAVLIVASVSFGRDARACRDLLRDPMIRHAYDERLLGALDAMASRTVPARVSSEGDVWTWTFEADTPVKARAVTQSLDAVAIITPSGRPIVILDPNGEAREILPVKGTHVSVQTDATTYTLDSNGQWRGNPPELFRPATNLPADATATLVAQEGQRYLLWRLPGRDNVAYLTGLTGLASPENQGFKTWMLLESADGRRIHRGPDRVLREVPSKGRVRTFLTEVIGRGAEGSEFVKWLATARHSLEDAVTLPGGPSFETLAKGFLVPADAFAERSRFTAWVGPEDGDRRQVLLLDWSYGRLFHVWDFEGWGKPPTFRLRNGWWVFADQNRWYTRGDGEAAAPPEIPPRPSGPVPGAAAEARALETLD